MRAKPFFSLAYNEKLLQTESQHTAKQIAPMGESELEIEQVHSPFRAKSA
jgi:hypothetical protein